MSRKPITTRTPPYLYRVTWQRATWVGENQSRYYTTKTGAQNKVRRELANQDLPPLDFIVADKVKTADSWERIYDKPEDIDRAYWTGA